MNERSHANWPKKKQQQQRGEEVAEERYWLEIEIGDKHEFYVNNMSTNLP